MGGSCYDQKIWWAYNQESTTVNGVRTSSYEQSNSNTSNLRPVITLDTSKCTLVYNEENDYYTIQADNIS